MRTTVILFLATTCTAQAQEWQFEAQHPSLVSYFIDAVETNTGWILVGNAFDPSGVEPAEVRLFHLDLNGNGTDTTRLWGMEADVRGTAALRRSGEQLVHVLGTYQHDGDTVGLLHYRTDLNANVVDSTLTVLDTIQGGLSMAEACFTSNGDIIGTLNGQTQAQGFLDRGILLKVAPNGSLLTQLRLVMPPGALLRNVIEERPDTLLVGCRKAPAYIEGENIPAAFIRLSTELDTLDHFIGPTLPDVSTPPYDRITDNMNTVVLPSGSLFMGGMVGTFGIFRAAVQKLAPDGTLIGSFYAPSAFTQDYPGFYRTLDIMPDGHLIFACLENYLPGFWGDPTAPTAPSRIHVYELDTSLNIICANLVDGSPDGDGYWLSRVKATSDGGYLLIGGRMDTDDPDARMGGWARKFRPTDCYTAIGDPIGYTVTHFFPNPASEHLQVVMEGPHQSYRLELVDVQGRVLHQAQVRSGRTELNIHQLPVGIYSGRIYSEKGDLIDLIRLCKY